jgi:hypothetical protein
MAHSLNDSNEVLVYTPRAQSWVGKTAVLLDSDSIHIDSIHLQPIGRRSAIPATSPS